MRKRRAQELADTTKDDDLLSTGEAADLLGVSRQHIVDLCDSGRLPFVLVGRHRRVRLGDIRLLTSSSARGTADQFRSLLLAHAVAGKLVQDPDAARALATANLAKMESVMSRGSAKVWITEWQGLLDAPLPRLLEALTGPSVRSRELRQNSPFAGLLTPEERQRVLAVARRESRGSSRASR